MIHPKLLIFSILMAFAAGLFGCVPARAATGLTIAPLRTEIEVLPGKSVKGGLKITNATNAPMSIELTSEGFRVVDEKYNYAFDPASRAASWVKFSEATLTLPAQGSRQVRYTITVPLDVKPGGYYISMFAGANVEASSSSIMARQRVGSLFYLTVAGDVARGGSLQNLNLPLIINRDSQWSMDIKSDAASHFHAHYRLAVYDLSGENLLSETKDSALILPDSIRHIQAPLNALKVPGVYRTTVTVELGDSPTYHETRLLIYLPLWLLFTCGAFGVAAIAILLIRRKKKG